tara:strand:- start:7 stop:885 length:879 start_codon:yes stop_codon:yes gene_type:complete
MLMEDEKKQVPREVLLNAKSSDDVLNYIKENKSKNLLFKKVLDNYEYNQELKELQTQFVNLQKWVTENNKKIAIIFEGRDASGKGGAIRRFIEHLNPRFVRVVSLDKPTEIEKGQWFFRRYIKHLPNPGEIVFFDRSWYNRAVVEPIMDFCSPEQYETFMVQVPEFEHMLYEENVQVIKIWFSVSKEEQLKRFSSRLTNPLKRWKYSAVDEKGQEFWDRYTYFKEQMFNRTHTSFCPWIIVNSDNKKKARLESMRYVLSRFKYLGKEKSATNLIADPNIVHRYFRMLKQIDS